MEQENENWPHPPAHLPGDDDDDVTQLNRILAELGSEYDGGAFVSVFKLDKLGRSGEFLDRYDAQEFVDGSLLDTVRNTWGAGKFQFNVYAAGGGLKTRKVVQIAPRKSDAVQHVPQVDAQGGAIVELLKAMQEQHRATMAGLEMIASALKSAPRETGDAEEKMLERMRVFKELFHVEQPAEKADTARALLEGVKLARELGAGGGDVSDSKWFEKVMDKLALPAMEMMAANATANAAAKTAKPALPAAPVNAAVSAAGAIQTEKQEEGEDMLAFKLGLKTLLRSARNGEDVNEVAERVLLMLPESDVQTIVAMPNWFEVMCHHEPDALVHKAWFEKLHASLTQQLNEPIE